MPTDPIRGKTLRWTYRDGPTAGHRFEHAFGRDGKVTWRMDGAAGKGETATYEAARLTPTVHVVSYLAPSGWALSTAIDFAAGAIVSTASNEKELVVQRGRLEEPGTGRARRAVPRPGRAAKTPRRPRSLAAR